MSLRRVTGIGVFLALGHAVATATPVAEPLPAILSATPAGFTIANTSKFYVVATLELTGTNFSAITACVVTHYLPAGATHNVAVAAKRKTEPIGYRVRVKSIVTKTLDELRLENNGNRVPPNGLPAASARQIESTICQSP